MTRRLLRPKKKTLNGGSNLYWGDSHTNLHGEWGHIAILDRTMKAARQGLDFFPIAYYPFLHFEPFKGKGLSIESCGPRKEFLLPQSYSNQRSDGLVVTYLGTQ